MVVASVDGIGIADRGNVSVGSVPVIRREYAIYRAETRPRVFLSA